MSFLLYVLHNDGLEQTQYFSGGSITLWILKHVVGTLRWCQPGPRKSFPIQNSKQMVYQIISQNSKLKTKIHHMFNIDNKLIYHQSWAKPSIAATLFLPIHLWSCLLISGRNLLRYVMGLVNSFGGFSSLYFLLNFVSPFNWL